MAINVQFQHASVYYPVLSLNSPVELEEFVQHIIFKINYKVSTWDRNLVIAESVLDVSRLCKNQVFG